MKLEDYFEVGYILKPHGLKGAVSILLDVDDPGKYEKMESVVVKMDNDLIPFFISSIQINGKKGIVQLKDINSVDQASELKSATLLLPIEMLPKLKDDQFYYHEVIGYDIIDKEKGLLGRIENIYTGGNQDLISMNYKGKEVLIPLNNDIVKQADYDKKEVHIQMPAGLLEIYL